MTARMYLVAYDIASPSRWRHVQKALRPLCRRQQLSVFACRGTPARLARLEAKLRRLMDPEEDRLMVLDLGPADTAAARLKSMNLMNEIPELEGFLI